MNRLSPSSLGDHGSARMCEHSNSLMKMMFNCLHFYMPIFPAIALLMFHHQGSAPSPASRSAPNRRKKYLIFMPFGITK